jgi:flagellar basal body-associated protein FliL
MKPGMIIIIVVVAVVAGIGSSFVFSRSLGKGGGGKPAQAAEKLPVQVLSLDERTVNLADTQDPHFLRITIALELEGKGELEKAAEEFKPKLLDCLISIASKHTFNSLISTEGKEKLKKELHEGYTEKMKDTGWNVREVLFTDFVME